jgi:hypothetical protein
MQQTHPLEANSHSDNNIENFPASSGNRSFIIVFIRTRSIPKRCVTFSNKLKDRYNINGKGKDKVVPML